MSTFLAHIRVHPGKEAEFEAIGAELHRESHAKDRGLVRYEYWRGAEPGTYYVLEAFEDYLSFLGHQTSDHHEAAVPGFADTIAELRLEWVDPVQGSSPLVPTEKQPLPDDASELAAKAYERFPCTVQPWWLPLRTAGN